MFDKNKAFSLLATDINSAIEYINSCLKNDALCFADEQHRLSDELANAYDDVFIRMTMSQLNEWIRSVIVLANDSSYYDGLKFLQTITVHWGVYPTGSGNKSNMVYNITMWILDKWNAENPVCKDTNTYSKVTDWAVRVDCGKFEAYELGMDIWKWLCAQSYYSAAETHTMRDLVECTSTANDKNEFANNVRALGLHPREYSSEFNKIMSLLPTVVGCEKILNMTIAEFADVWSAVDGEGNKRFI